MQLKLIISKDVANAEIRNYLGFREESINKNIHSGLSDKAKNYFRSGEVSFIFKKSELDDLFKDTDANAFRVYYAAHPEDGTPTMVVVLCSISEDAKTIVNIIKSDDEAADEYPTSSKTKGTKQDFDIKNDDVIP